MSESFRAASKKEWTPALGLTADREQVAVGALQRIADATELMAANVSGLIAERDRYKRWYEGEVETTKGLYRQLRAMRGVVTRLKNRAAFCMDPRSIRR